MPTETDGLRQMERAAALRSMLADKLAGDLAAFVKKAWPILHPTRPLVWSWHYEYNLVNLPVGASLST